MFILNEIRAPIKQNLEIFNEKFKLSLKSQVPLLDKIMSYVIKTKGKQIRPMLVFFSADIFGEINDSSYRAASMIELLHTATLIHDDVVDDANLRRGFLSIKAVWKNKIAVLIGDYLLSKGLLLSLENDDFELLKIVSNAVREMSEGELLQIQKARTFDISEDIYFDVIRKKTASLIASCCSCGAASVTKDKDIIEKMRKLGENIGIAFQIKDDLLDYEKTDVTGKSNGVDIKDQKMTLPLIYLLNNSSYMSKKKYVYYLKNHNNDAKKIAELVNSIQDKGGIEYAKNKMLEYQNKALEILRELPDNNSRKSLEQLIIFTTERKN
jgi:octaprenyl-diphosphate synthase